MADVSGAVPRSQESFRGTAILAYVLLLAGLFSFHLAGVAAVILAYVQRGDARDTLWETHFDNIIVAFWVSLLVTLIAIPLCLVVVGFFVLGIVLIWFLYRTIKGLIRALDGRPYF